VSAGADSPIIAEAHVTPKGYRRLLTHLAVRPLRWVAPIVAFAGFAALGGGRTGEALVLIGGLAGVFLIIWGYVSYMSSSPSVSVIYLPVRYEFDDRGIRYESDGECGEIPWSGISRWKFAAEHYLLYVSGGTYLLVPAETFEPAEEQRFATLLREHVARGPWRR
jgi:hypothetical protein